MSVTPTPSARSFCIKTRLLLAKERAELEDSLLSFVEGAWPSLDPSAYQSCWAIDALCEHLQAVTNGQIKKLLMNELVDGALRRVPSKGLPSGIGPVGGIASTSCTNVRLQIQTSKPW
jgi:hypothetical protein